MFRIQEIFLNIHKLLCIYEPVKSLRLSQILILLTNDVVANCSVFLLFCKLGRTFRRWWRFLVPVLVFGGRWEISISVCNSEIIISSISLKWHHSLAWICSSRCSGSVLCIRYFRVSRVILRLSTRRWYCSTYCLIVLYRTCCTSRSLWSVWRCPSLRNSQSSIIFRITSLCVLLIGVLVKVVVEINTLFCFQSQPSISFVWTLSHITWPPTLIWVWNVLLLGIWEARCCHVIFTINLLLDLWSLKLSFFTNLHQI